MEPVFMVLGQSAASAALLAIESKTSVQGIDYAKLATRLQADGQVLDFESPPAPVITGWAKEKLDGIIVDDTEAHLTGFDSEGHVSPGYVGEGYRHDDNAAKGAQHARFVPDLPRTGKYQVSVSYSVNGNRATNVLVKIGTAEGAQTVSVNQRKKPQGHAIFHTLGEFDLPVGKASWVEISNEGTDGHVIVDAVRWVEVR
jgi:hypothetical protein